MKKIILLLFVSVTSFAQVGIGTTNPQGALDISSSTLGLVLPRVTQLESVTNNNAGLAEDGTVVYDVSRNKTCFRISSTWICLANNATLAIETVSPTPPPAAGDGTASDSSSSVANSSKREDQ